MRRLRDAESPTLTQCEKDYLIKIIARLLLRNPYFFESIKRNWRVRIARWAFWISLQLKRKAKESIKEAKLSVSDAVDSEMRSLTATYDVSVLVSALSRSRQILYLIPKENTQAFVLGNQPCLLQRKKWHQDDNGSWRSEIGDMDIYAVLDPFLMVGLVSTLESDEVMTIDRDDIKRINGLIVKYNAEVVARSSSDLEGTWYQLFEGEEEIRWAKELPEETSLVRLSVESHVRDQQDPNF